MTTLRSFLRKPQQIPIFHEGFVIDLPARIRDFAVSKIGTDKRRNRTWAGFFQVKMRFCVLRHQNFQCPASGLRWILQWSRRLQKEVRDSEP